MVWNEFLFLPVWNLDLSVSGAMAYVQFAIPVTPPAIRTRVGLSSSRLCDVRVWKREIGVCVGLQLFTCTSVLLGSKFAADSCKHRSKYQSQEHLKVEKMSVI